LVEAKTLAVARRIGGVPRSQLVMHKLVVN
jgi:hypothetical protein